MMENVHRLDPFQRFRNIADDFESDIGRLIENHTEWFRHVSTNQMDQRFAQDLASARDTFLGNGEWHDDNERTRQLENTYTCIRTLKHSSDSLVEFYRSNGNDNDERIQRAWSDVIDATMRRIDEFRNDIMVPKAGLPDKKTIKVQGLGQAGSYWWLQVKSWLSDWPVGEIYSAPTHSTTDGKNRIFDNYFKASLGDLVIMYEGAPGSQVRALGKVVKQAMSRSGDTVHVEIVYQFDQLVSLDTLKTLIHFSRSNILHSKGTLFELTRPQFDEVIEQAGLELLDTAGEHVFNEAYRAVIDNDTSATDDLLSFTKDINSFAMLLSMRDTKPPLAIALFGQWGSGKSFFMGRLMAAIRELSANQGFPTQNGVKKADPEPGKEIFCKGIVQIEFNAWSYLDSNLWAGLVSTIFEKLDEYIDNNASDDEKEAVRNELNQKLQIVSAQKQSILKEKQELEEQQERLRDEIEKKRESKEKILDSIKEETFEDIKQRALQEAKPIVDQVRGKLDEFGITQDRVNALSPDALFDEVRSWVTFARNLLKFKWWHSVVFILGLLGVGYLIFDPGSFIQNKLHAIEKVVLLAITAFGPVVAKAIDSFHKYKQVFAPILAYKNTFNERVKSAEYDHQNRLQLLEAELMQRDSQLAGLKSKLDAVNQEVKDVEYSLANSITKQAFFNFIAKRSGDGVYEKHLGLISTIRRDFQTMTDLFIGANEEKRRPIEAAKSTDIPEVTALETSEFRRRFEKPLDRIVLYIDDLDRCTDDKVIDVLQAVHLLMAYRLFIVVVGVDKRCVQNALVYRNLLQYSQFCKNNDMEFLSQMGISIIKPSEYLEKIFQIPFHLDEPGLGNIKFMIGELLKKQVQQADHENGEEVSIDPVPQAPAISPPWLEVTSGAANVIVDQPSTTGDIEVTESAAHKKEEAPVYVAPERLQLSPWELTCLQEFAWMIGSNPRNVKRYINIYKIVRAHELLTFTRGQREPSFLKVMFILAFNIGRYSELADVFYSYCRSNGNETVSHFLEGDARFSGVIDMLREGQNIYTLLTMRGGDFAPYLSFLKRFSFTMQDRTSIRVTTASQRLGQSLSNMLHDGPPMIEDHV